MPSKKRRLRDLLLPMILGFLIGLATSIISPNVKAQIVIFIIIISMLVLTPMFKSKKNDDLEV